MDGSTKNTTVQIKIENSVTDVDECRIKLENSGDIKEETSTALCRTCMIGDNLKDMMQTYYYKGKPEVYSEMLAYCFSIQYQIGFETREMQYLICDACISRLRDAALFRNQIEEARQTFQRAQDVKSPAAAEFVDFGDFSEIDCAFNSPLSDEDVDFVPKASKVSASKIKKKSPSISKHTPKKKKTRRKADSATPKTENLQDYNTEPEEKLSRIRKREELPYKLGKNDLECKLCGEQFPVHQRLQIHMNIHFPNHICETCGCAFSTRRQLNNHTASHTAPRLPCPLCPSPSLRLFKGSSALGQHMRQHHSHRQIYRCSMCDVRFDSFNARRKHLVEVHGEENKKYVCKHCPKRFCLSTHLAAHVRNVHLQERTHECAVCSMAFFRKRGLATHMLKHTGERSFHCSVCGKRYGRKYTLTEHMKIHTNDRRHVCSVCGKAFTQKATLKGHATIHMKKGPKLERVNHEPSENHKF